MALCIPNGVSDDVVVIPIMTYTSMDKLLSPYIRQIVSTLKLSDLRYSVWVYNNFADKVEFLEGNMEIPMTEDTTTVYFSANQVDFYVLCVQDVLLKKQIQAMYRSEVTLYQDERAS